jgi:hypothetical protein
MGVRGMTWVLVRRLRGRFGQRGKNSQLIIFQGVYGAGMQWGRKTHR